ncbi:MAG: alpha/beta fold hydrolase, partial [SAR202 cluster bacterium]|nr:alpha/beta fold hydrolase [SAR202 cluster bacterium]
MPTFRTPDRTTLYYEEHGAGEPLLLVAGQGSDHHGWDAVLGDFAAHYRCITWDHRGTGASDKPEAPPYSIEGFAADAIALLDHLGIGSAHAYGVSMGGRICQRLAISHANRMEAVVLGCTTPGNRCGVRRPPEVDTLMANRPADIDARVAFQLPLMVSERW